MNTARWRLAGVVAAGALARFGESLAGVAVIWLVMQLGQGAADLGALAAVATGAFVVSSLWGGALVDRFGARRIAVAGIVFSALPVAALAHLAGSETLGMGVVLALVLVGQLPDGATAAATDARLPELAEEAGIPLERINAADDLIDGSAAIAGAPIAGLIIAAAGIQAALWTMVCLSAGAALLCLLFIPGAVASIASSPARGASALAGLGHIVGRRDLLALTALAAVLITVFQALEDLVVPVMVTQLGRGADGLGIVLGCAGAGAVAGATLYMVLATRVTPARMLAAMTALISVGVAVIAVWPGWTVMLAGAAVAGVGAGSVSPLVSTRLQRSAPSELRGRVLGAAAALMLSLTPFTAVVAGLAIDAFGVRSVTALLAAAVLALAIIAVRHGLPQRPARD